jgi:GH25 family lysozyme M1 (1,4-beta-N-acetylmuramidase)
MRRRHITATAAAAAVLITTLSGCGSNMISVPDGTGGQMLVERYDNLPVADYQSQCFYADGQYIDYRSSDEKYIALSGVDVSEHQQEIDWYGVKSDNVDFAVIRAGYRGYSEGKLAEDEFFRENMAGASQAGIDIGVYFFSQAVSVEEARQEAEFLLELLDGYEITLPVFFDWEPITYEDSRTANIDGTTLTDCCLEFCSVIEAAGYDAGVYFYRSLGYQQYELDRLEDLIFWAAAPGDYPDFYYYHTFWQYSYTAQVSGIEGDADLDLMFVKVEQ